jgi:hypothetical protein
MGYKCNKLSQMANNEAPHHRWLDFGAGPTTTKLQPIQHNLRSIEQSCGVIDGGQYKANA